MLLSWPWVSASVSHPLIGLQGESKVENGQQGEDARLDKADEHIEKVPGGFTNGRRDVERQEGYHRKHDAAGQDVPEEPQCQRERADDFFDEVEWGEPNRAPGRKEHVLDV